MPSEELIIQFVGKRRIFDPQTGKPKLVPCEAPRQRLNGNQLIELPSSWAQKRGFTHPDAKFLLSAYRKDFKLKKSKGK